MSTATTETLRMWLKQETDAALLVTSAPALGRVTTWIPRSLVDRLTKSPRMPGSLDFPAIEFTLPAWKVEQAGLGEFVIS